MTADFYDQLVDLAARWDLVELQRQLSQVLDEVEEAQRAYVPTALSRALAMFLDSYGPPGVRWSEDSLPG